MVATRTILLTNLNESLTCSLCSGYFIDATKLLDCLHTFCRSCILKYFENSSVEKCPICRQPCKEKRPDMTLQTLVFKLVPGLYAREIQRREDFYRTAGVRASSSCSDDSVIGDNMEDHEEWIYTLGSENPFLSADDSISLSLEYYQSHLDNSAEERSKNSDQNSAAGVVKTISDVKIDDPSAKSDKEKFGGNKDNNNKTERRFLQCPAAVKMTHLQKFVRMKFALCEDHKVDIIYSGEVLPSHFTLMDVAYTFKWNKTKPLRFFYRIFTQGKVKPIRIINTSTTIGQKHLQVVSIKTPSVDQKAQQEALSNKILEDEQTNKDKERLMSELKLQVRKKPIVEVNHRVGEVKLDKPLSFPFDQDEEMKKFAESRDREWQLLKTPEEEHKSKKRKKNKHSKDQPHKKPKLHAEITSEESLKLKVKLTQHNGHKHKHHKSTESRSHIDQTSKEKINQLRQIRHKNVSNEEKLKKTDTKRIDKTKDLPKLEIKIDRIITEVKTPEVKTREIKTPEVKTPEVKTRDVKAPEVKTRDVKTSEVKTRDVKTPEVKPREVKAPEVIVKKDTPKQRNLQKLEIKQVIEKPARLEKIVKPEEKKTAQTEKALRQQIQRLNPHPKPAKVDPPKPEQPKKLISLQYLPGFTVSKIEQGVKRKLDTDEPKDNRPSLEITPIHTNQRQPIKRPPPPTIPLERIKNSVNFSGVSIIPKQPEKLAQTGPLDLSKPHKLELKPEVIKNGNGIKITDKSALSNLQMLSKVATEHANIKQTMSSKPKPQMPSLETIKIPQVSTAKSSSVQTDKKLPKLHEISKGQFKMLNTTRSVRPVQNQCIRNIPNPSLLVRQQNQNRLNCLNMQKEIAEKRSEDSTVSKTEDGNKAPNLITI